MLLKQVCRVFKNCHPPLDRDLIPAGCATLARARACATSCGVDSVTPPIAGSA